MNAQTIAGTHAAPAASATPETIVAVWSLSAPDSFDERTPELDPDTHERLHGLHDAAARGALAGWPQSPTGALALILLLDRFPRSAFRGTPRMFATDGEARRAADAAIDGWLDEAIEPGLRPLCYLPFANSENFADQDRSVALARPLGGATLDAAERRRAIIKRFGRFPDRNAILGRETRAEEQRFLAAEAEHFHAGSHASTHAELLIRSSKRPEASIRRALPPIDATSGRQPPSVAP